MNSFQTEKHLKIVHFFILKSNLKLKSHIKRPARSIKTELRMSFANSITTRTQGINTHHVIGQRDKQGKYFKSVPQKFNIIK